MNLTFLSPIEKNVTSAVVPNRSLALQSIRFAREDWLPTALSQIVHQYPHLNESFQEVNDTFDWNDMTYRKSLIIGGSFYLLIFLIVCIPLLCCYASCIPQKNTFINKNVRILVYVILIVCLILLITGLVLEIILHSYTMKHIDDFRTNDSYNVLKSKEHPKAMDTYYPLTRDIYNDIIEGVKGMDESQIGIVKDNVLVSSMKYSRLEQDIRDYVPAEPNHTINPFQRVKYLELRHFVCFVIFWVISIILLGVHLFLMTFIRYFRIVLVIAIMWLCVFAGCLKAQAMVIADGCQVPETVADMLRIEETFYDPMDINCVEWVKKMNVIYYNAYRQKIHVVKNINEELQDTSNYHIVLSPAPMAPDVNLICPNYTTDTKYQYDTEYTVRKSCATDKLLSISLMQLVILLACIIMLFILLLTVICRSGSVIVECFNGLKNKIKSKKIFGKFKRKKIFVEKKTTEAKLPRDSLHSLRVSSEEVPKRKFQPKMSQTDICQFYEKASQHEFPAERLTADTYIQGSSTSEYSAQSDIFKRANQSVTSIYTTSTVHTSSIFNMPSAKLTSCLKPSSKMCLRSKLILEQSVSPTVLYGRAGPFSNSLKTRIAKLLSRFQSKYARGVDVNHTSQYTFSLKSRPKKSNLKYKRNNTYNSKSSALAPHMLRDVNTRLKAKSSVNFKNCQLNDPPDKSYVNMPRLRNTSPNYQSVFKSKLTSKELGPPCFSLASPLKIKQSISGSRFKFRLTMNPSDSAQSDADQSASRHQPIPLPRHMPSGIDGRSEVKPSKQVKSPTLNIFYLKHKQSFRFTSNAHAVLHGHKRRRSTNTKDKPSPTSVSELGSSDSAEHRPTLPRSKLKKVIRNERNLRITKKTTKFRRIYLKRLKTIQE